MFYKVFRRDPFFSFFDDDDEDDFVTGMDDITDFPFRMAPLGALALTSSPAVFRGKENQKRSLKRKCCSCTCEKEGKKVEAQENCPKSSEESPKSQEPSPCKEVEITPPSKKTRFEVNLNVDRHYKPGELKVKLSADNRSLTVEGSHQECKKVRNGFSKVSSQYFQRIPLPKDVDVERLKCDLNENGEMVISAPRMLPALEEKGKEIPITIDLEKEGDEETSKSNVQKESEKEKPAVESNDDSTA